MHNQTLRYLLCVFALHASAGIAQASASQHGSSSASQSRQVILIIGDGMDEQQITIARNYLEGATGLLQVDQLPLRSSMQILTTEDQENGKSVYVADSANTATSMATGVVMSRGRISTSAGGNEDLTTIVEMASARGLRTGIVTTASITDATPAAFAAHISLRLCENPEKMVDITFSGIPVGDCSDDLKANGGNGSIAEQLADSSLDVMLGGGAKHFLPDAEGETESVTRIAERNGFQVVTTATELAAASPDKRLLGLFAPSTLPVRWQGENGRAAEEPKRSWLNHIHPFLGSVTQPKPMTCEPNPEFATVPDLQKMTEAALSHLSHNNDTGFFLMIESASIDKQSHERKPCGSIGEVQQLEEALTSALAFAEAHPRTLILVTADHSQAAQLIPYVSLFAGFPIPTSTPGMTARVITPEGGHMSINYATSTFMMEEHTGASVPLFSNSEGLGLVGPFVQQPQIFEIVRDYLRL